MFTLHRRNPACDSSGAGALLLSNPETLVHGSGWSRGYGPAIGCPSPIGG